MTGPVCATTPCSVDNACLVASCAPVTAVIASATLWRSATSDAVVYGVFPSVNDPLGKCFCVPAMSACTAAKAAALVLDFVVLDMVFFSFLEGAHRQDGEPQGADAPGGVPAVVVSLIETL